MAGLMTADEAAAFEQHYLACDVCLQTVRGIEDVRDILAERRAALARGEADPLPAPRLAPARPAARRWSRKSQAWTGATWVAAAAALIAAVGWMFGLSWWSSPGAGISRAPVPNLAGDAVPGSAEPHTPSTPSGT